MSTNNDKLYALGIDIGATTAKIGLVDRTGNILLQTVCPSNDTDDEHLFIRHLKAAINTMIDGRCAMHNIAGIGVGAPAANYYTGNIEYAANLTWCNNKCIPFAKILSEEMLLPVTITNDANAAAMGEMTYGVAQGMKHFIMITLGTGVGSGIVIDGKVLYGHDGFAGELGHTIIERHNGRPCGCGRSGCLQQYTSASGVVITAQEMLAQSDQPSLLRHIDNNLLTSKDIYNAATQGDSLAKEIFRYTGEKLGLAFADFVAFSSPEAIILFGGLARAKDYIFEPMLDTMNRNLIAFWKGKVQILFSSLRESDAAILGASALAWGE